MLPHWLQKLYTIPISILPLCSQKKWKPKLFPPSLIKNCLLHSRKQLQQTGGIQAVAKTLLNMWPQNEGNIGSLQVSWHEVADWHFYITGCYNLKVDCNTFATLPHAPLNTGLAPQNPFSTREYFLFPSEAERNCGCPAGRRRRSWLTSKPALQTQSQLSWWHLSRILNLPTLVATGDRARTRPWACQSMLALPAARGRELGEGRRREDRHLTQTKGACWR